MREMSTDRPDKTESPFTVDAGHVQIESDLFTATRDGATTDGSRVDAFSVGGINFKLGLLNNVDLQIVAVSYSRVRTEDAAGQVTRQSGFGDLTVRTKINVWGNDRGPTAFAVMPFVKFPTNEDELGNDAVEGGVILPLAIELPLDFSLGVMTEFDFNEDADGRGYHTDFVNTITLSRDLFVPLGGYVEFATLVSTDADSDWLGTIDVGLVYAVTENIQLDAGVNLGVTRAADDVSPFVGLSIRF
jgi:outer membrane putative beta-barrel porin/alpha-amylase